MIGHEFTEAPFGTCNTCGAPLDSTGYCTRRLEHGSQIHDLAPGEVRTVSATGGEKGQKLARFDLIPTGPLWEVAELYGIGASKYAERNWERGYEWSKSYSAMMRHLNQFWQGKNIDDGPGGTGKPHLACAIFHAMALLEFTETHPEFDDRPGTIEP